MAQKSSIAFALLAAAAAGCSTPAPGNCPLTVWYRPALVDPSLAGSMPALVGSWDGWARPGLRAFTSATASDGTEWSSATINLPPGTYQYGVLLGQTLIADDINPRTAFVAGDGGIFASEVSEVVLADCSAPALSIVSAQSSSSTLSISADYVPGSDGVTLDPSTLAATLMQGTATLEATIALTHSDGGNGITHVSAKVASLTPGKYTLRLDARDRKGRALAASGSAFVATAPQPATLGDELVYQVMVDRFRGDGGSALAPPGIPGARAGGTLAGVEAMLTSGYFDELGVTTLWISPQYTNTDNFELGADGHPETPYHGYWPEAPRTADPRFGGAAALDTLVATAHARGMRVILDVVPNHVYKDHPYYAEHSRMTAGIAASPTATTPLAQVSWFNDGPDHCVCGAADCDWGTHMETCWFADYMPDLNWRHPSVMQQGSDDLVWWLSRFDLDGVRIDAVPMMPRAAERRMLAAMHGMMYRGPQDLLVVGEVYTGPGDAGREQIKAYLGNQLDGLDSAFDFPVMWAARDAIAHNVDGGFTMLESELAAGISTWSGSGAVIARMIGNHDTTRFISEANGDAGNDTYSNPPVQPSDPAPYLRQLVALAFVMTTPGIPVIYYGDEVGLAGGSDPDSRRVMPDSAALSPPQAQLLAAVGKFGRARRCASALRGQRSVLLADADHDAAFFTGGTDHALVILSRDVDDTTLMIPNLPAGTWQDALSGAVFSSDGAHDAAVTVPSLSAAVYLPKESACLR